MRRIRLDARGDAGKVHQAARVEREILDLRLHHRRRNGETLDFHLLHALDNYFLRGQLGDPPFHRELEPRPLPDRQLHRLAVRLVADGAHGHRIRAGEEAEHAELAGRPGHGPHGFLRRVVDHGDGSAGQRTCLILDRALECDRVLSVHRKGERRRDHGGNEQALKRVLHGDSETWSVSTSGDRGEMGSREGARHCRAVCAAS